MTIGAVLQKVWRVAVVPPRLLATQRIFQACASLHLVAVELANLDRRRRLMTTLSYQDYSGRTATLDGNDRISETPPSTDFTRSCSRLYSNIEPVNPASVTNSCMRSKIFRLARLAGPAHVRKK